MKTYSCICNNRLFFDNTSCTSCNRAVGWCEACSRITAWLPNGDEFVCGSPTCNAKLFACANYATHGVCNRGIPVEEETPAGLCRSCRLTAVIPDLSVDGNLLKWSELEAAKSRLLFELDALRLPYDRKSGARSPLSFHFEADTATAPVRTGHANGVISVNIAEADPVAREVSRQQFAEPHRTLIGHLRHEISHYYYMTLVNPKRMTAFVEYFGDPDALSYDQALKRYYEHGPPLDWPDRFVSAYATAHPWEDFAETFAYYLDMRSVCDTATHHLAGIMVNTENTDLASLIEVHGHVGVIVNELNRSMGLTDLLPEVVAQQWLAKLEFCHSLVGQTGSMSS